MSGPLPLSLCVITRDAAAQLADCLASVPFAGEIVVVDSGSRDDTVEIARRSGARVIEHDWPGFGAQKNFAVGQARHDWVLCLDADERADAGARGRDPRRARDRRRSRGRRRPTRWRAATAFSAAGSPTAKAIPTGTFACSTAAAPAGPTTPCTRTWSPTARSRALPAICCTPPPNRSMPTSAKQNRYTTLQAEAMHARGERAGAAQARAVAAGALRPVLRRAGRASSTGSPASSTSRSAASTAS